MSGARDGRAPASFNYGSAKYHARLAKEAKDPKVMLSEIAITLGAIANILEELDSRIARLGG
jgi:hypothetical protein